MTDDKLKAALAKMLLEHVIINGHEELVWHCNELPAWLQNRMDIESGRVLDTELLHLCAMVEKTLTDDEDQIYRDEIFRTINEREWAKTERILMRSTWQQRATALAKVKGIEV